MDIEYDLIIIVREMDDEILEILIEKNKSMFNNLYKREKLRPDLPTFPNKTAEKNWNGDLR